MDQWGLPGLRARYEFVPAGDDVEIRLDLRFDPAGAGLTEAGRSLWLELRDRIAGGQDNRALPAVALVTSLAPEPLTVTSDGVGLRERFADFLSLLSETPAEAGAPLVAELAFRIPKAGAADLPADIFELALRLEIGPVPIAVAVPRLGEAGSAAAFAASFEACWQGFDGADGGLALAVDAGPEGETFWCVRTGARRGIALAGPAQDAIVYRSVPPLSTVPISGETEMEEGAERFEDIDLDSWWDAFAAEVDRIGAMAAAGDPSERFRRLRSDLAGGLAGRLLPVTPGGAGDSPGEVRTVFEERAAADLRSRPVIASAEVEIRRGARLLGETAPVLRGRIAAPADGRGTLPAAVRLKAGLQSLA
jgi:hypothetical protein